MKKRIGNKQFLIRSLIFFPIIIVPAVILTMISLKSLSREEAFFRHQIENSIQQELSQTIVQINSELIQIQNELKTSFEKTAVTPIASKLNNWASQTPLIDIPFLVSSNFNLIEPKNKMGISDRQQLFISRNKEFLTNRIEIPIWQNIAKLYREDILEKEKKTKTKKSKVLAQSDSSFMQELEVQQAVTLLEQDSILQEEIYNQVESKGGTLNQRWVKPKSKNQMRSFSRKAPLKQEDKGSKKGLKIKNQSKDMIKVRQVEKKRMIPVLRVKSILVANERSFENIIANKSIGLIPRIQNDQLGLFFWMRLKNGKFAGGSISMDILRNRLAQLIPQINNGTRIINLMNEYGNSLLDPNQNISEKSWLSPFISREISETLPGWELAAQLVDSNYIKNRANQRIFTTTLLIALLAISMLGGGLLLYFSTMQQIKLAMIRTGFVAAVSHELKTPLTSIRMYAEMLRDGRLKEKKKEKIYLETIVSESERLTRLINNVLDFSRLEKGTKFYDMQEQKLEVICSDLIENQRIRLEQKGFKVEWSVPKISFIILSDAEALRQVLINLISNSEKYSEEKKLIKISLKKENQKALLIVEDSGIGIPTEAQKSVFKEFYRVDDRLIAKVSGSGLGLSISKKIIEDHQGTIVCRSSNLGGASFEIRLPILVK